MEELLENAYVHARMPAHTHTFTHIQGISSTLRVSSIGLPVGPYRLEHLTTKSGGYHRPRSCKFKTTLLSDLAPLHYTMLARCVGGTATLL